VFLVIEQQGDETRFIGPFYAREKAQSWAAHRATKAIVGDQRGVIDVAANGDAVTLLTDKGDVKAEWLVEPMNEPDAF